MEVIFLLIAFSLGVALTFLGLFFWAVRDGQYDDGHTPAIRMLFDSKPSNKQDQNDINDNNNHTD